MHDRLTVYREVGLDSLGRPFDVETDERLPNGLTLFVLPVNGTKALAICGDHVRLIVTEESPPYSSCDVELPISLQTQLLSFFKDKI